MLTSFSIGDEIAVAVTGYPHLITIIFLRYPLIKSKAAASTPGQSPQYLDCKDFSHFGKGKLRHFISYFSY